jgi:gliding motility-associated-like protein
MKKNTLIRTACSLLLLMSASAMKSQMVGPNAYVKATNLEIGIAGAGGFEGVDMFASPVLPGMHPRSGTNFFGFVANPQLNAWATFDGDFFTPGSSENGWGIDIPSLGITNADNNCNFENEIPGSITNFTHSTSCISVDWEGDLTTGTNLHFKVNYFMEETDLYYTTTVTITNNTGATINDIYYYRNLDPDNNQPIAVNVGFEYWTNNTVLCQPGVNGSNIAAVSATSTDPYPSFMGLAAVGANWRACYGGFSNRDGFDLWNGVGFVQTVGVTNFFDEGIALAYKINSLAPGASETFKFNVILDDAAASNLLSVSYPGSAPPQICDTAIVDTIAHCGSPVPLTLIGSTVDDYNWTWSPATGLNTTVGPAVIANPSVDVTYTATGTIANPCLPPATVTVSFVMIILTPQAPPQITPVAPVCQGSAPFNLVVDSTGGIWSGPGITNATAGTFDPATAGSFDVYYSTGGFCPQFDTTTVDVLGTASANITQPPVFCDGDPAASLVSATAGGIWSGPGITSPTGGIFDPSVSGVGIFEIFYNIGGSCPSVDSVDITVGAVVTPVTGFSYTTPVCKATGINPVPSTVPGFTPGGTFTFTPAGLSINSSTGEINLAASAAGTYTVTYTIPATVCGPAGTTTSTIQIQAVIPPVLTFSYPPVCYNTTGPAPILPGTFTTGGTFSSTDITVDALTGVVDITGVAAGSYTVSYTVVGSNILCTGSGTSTATVIVNTLPTVGTTFPETMWIGSSTVVAANGGSSYVWSPVVDSCVNAICDSVYVSPDETTDYCVVVTDANGCIDSGCVKITIEIPCPSNRNLVVPNAFTPNNDGNNDELCLYGWDDCVTDFQIVIYDRWGEKMYESSDANFCWDGKYKGKLLDPAVFVYFIKASYLKAGATINDPETIFDLTKKGNISLVR